MAQSAPQQPAATLPAWPVITQRDMDEAAKRVRMPLASGAPAVHMRPGALPQPETASTIDLQALARGFERQQKPIAPFQQASGMLILVSFSVPEPSLARLVEQAEAAGASIVLRGLDRGSLKRTVQRAQTLIGKRNVSFQIDPQTFDRFGVTAVPAFVLLRTGGKAEPCAGGMCFAGDEFAMVTGDVSLDYALEQIARLAPHYAGQTGALLRKMKGAP